MPEAQRLYHITSAREAEEAEQEGVYLPAAFDRDGFIHCSYRHQVIATADRIFRGRRDLVLLEIDKEKLDCRVVEENLEGGKELFPHIYGPLKMRAVIGIHKLRCNSEGTFTSE